MKHIPLEAWPRTTESRTSGARSVRGEGFVPGILVGHHETALPLKVKSGDLTRVLKAGGRNALVDLSIEGQSAFAMVREFRRDPRSRHIVHIDFQRVAANEPIEAPVPLVITGEPGGAYEGYVVTHEAATVIVKAVPDALPAHLDVDASKLEPGHPVHASDIALPEGVTLVTDPTHVIATLTPPRIAEHEAEEAEAELAEEEAKEGQVPETE